MAMHLQMFLLDFCLTCLFDFLAEPLDCSGETLIVNGCLEQQFLTRVQRNPKVPPVQSKGSAKKSKKFLFYFND